MTDLAARLAELTTAQRRLLAEKLGLLDVVGPAPTPVAPEPIAIVGMGCRLPGAIDSPDGLWRALCAGRDLISEVPADRWAADEWFDADPMAPGRINTRHGGFLDDISGFDRTFFGISAGEAARMDPQQRILLEVAHDALADAGIPSSSLGGTDTAVFMASMTDDYAWLLADAADAVTVHTSTGLQRSILANRLSYLWDLRGPSIAVDTACSSSLTAVHLACQAIRSGEAETALAGGVNVMASPVMAVIYAKLGALSPDGRCKTFDAAANGLVRAEGAGVVVLKRLSAAVRDGNPVWALVHGSAAGQDGRTSGITAPRGPAQTAVVRAALARAGVAHTDVTLVETHGTGTPLGDPLEVEALAHSVGAGRGAESPCLLGAVKTNLGHLEAAAGVVGLIKTALSVHHRLVPPVLHQVRRNPKIDFASMPFVVPTVPTPLPDGYAGVSSFGFGGSLAHAVLGAAPTRAAAVVEPDAARVIVVGARSGAALDALAASYADVLSRGDVSLADLARTTVHHRDRHSHRRAVAGVDVDTAVRALRASTRSASVSAPPGVAFVYSGQGTFDVTSAAALYGTDTVFRAAVDESDAAFRAQAGYSPRDLLLGDGGREGVDRQSVQFSVQYALTALWAARGVRPSVVLGQSLGEVTAALTAGALDLPGAVRIVAARERALSPLAGTGANAVVELDADATAALARRAGLTVAGQLGPSTFLLSGDADAVSDAVDRVSASGDFARLLGEVTVPAHCDRTAATTPGLVSDLADLVSRPARLPLVSTVTGAVVDEAPDARYWARNVAEPFHLPNALATAVGLGAGCVVEVSTHPALVRALGAAVGPGVRVVGTLVHGEAPAAALAGAAAALVTAGVDVDPAALAPDGRAERLPGYPWQREPAWLPPRGDSHPNRTLSAPISRNSDANRPVPDPPVSDSDANRPVPDPPDGDELVETLRTMWADVLVVDRERVGPDTNFFDLGGDSLKGFWLVRRISEDLDVRVPMAVMAGLLTVRDLAGAVRTIRDGDPARTQVTSEPATPEPAEPEEPARTPAPDDGAPPVDADRHEPFDLLPIQRAYWIGQGLDLGGVPARHYLEYELTDVDPARLEAAWNRLVRRHEMLRVVVDDDGRQRIRPSVAPYRIPVLDLADADSDRVERELDAVRSELLDPPPVAPDDWLPFALRISLLPGGTTRLHLGVDMVAFDGRSFGVLSDEWRRLHDDPGATLPALDLSFRDVVALHAAADDDRAAADEYWEPLLAELPAPPALPFASEPADLGVPTFHRRSVRIPRERWAPVRAAANAAGIGPTALLLAIYADVLGTWSADPRFTVTVTAFTLRTVHPSANDIVGDFTSTVPVALDATGARTLRDRAMAAQRQLWSDMAHPGRSGVEVAARANAVRTDGAFRLGIPYVFTSLFSGDDADDRRVPFGWLGTRRHSVAQTPQVLMDLHVMQDLGDLVLDFDTIDAMFPDGLPAAVLDAVAGVVARLADGDGWDLSPLALTPAEQLTARRAANRTDAPVAAGGLHEPFTTRARREPDRPALVAGGSTLTYGDLDELSEHIATLLDERRIGPGAIVAVGLQRGVAQIAALIGVLKTGAAYVPVDPALPALRRRYLVEHTGAAAVLVEPGDDTDWFAPTLDVDGETTATPRERATPGGDDLAYVIHTSGSTGEPKGVRVHHRAALNTVLDVNARFGIGRRDAVLALSSASFDLSVWDVFGILAAGARIVAPDDDRARDPEHWAHLVRTHGVTVWNSVPALYGMYVDHLTDDGGGAGRLHTVLLSGDWIPLALPEHSRTVAPDTDLISLGGATEAAIWSIHHPIDELDPSWPSIPYGRPLANQRVHVCNAAGEPCPDWVPGDLWIAGVGLAQGYHDDPERTAASFPVHRASGERRYRTGDRARYRPDGTVEFLGRTDQQVKVRGHRIELGEVEAALLALPGMRAAAVVVLGARDGARSLAAHVVVGDAPLDARAVRGGLAERLPAHLVPPTVTFWTGLPLTPNGKVDRAALIAAGADESAGGVEGLLTVPGTAPVDDAPRTGVERVLADIWAAVLDVDRVGRDDRFFAVGGDSVLGIQVVSRAARAGVRITPRDLFLHQSVAELAAVATVTDPALAEPVVEAAQRETTQREARPTPIQRWFLDLELSHPDWFNQTLLLEPTAGPLDADRLAGALEIAVARHEALRLRWDRGTGADWRQYAATECGLVVDRVPLDAVEDRSAAVARAAAMCDSGLDLTVGPTVRAALLIEDGMCTGALVAVHHLAIDGVSWRVLLDDVAAAYQGVDLGEPGPGFLEHATAVAGRPAQRAGLVAAWHDRLDGPLATLGSAGTEGDAAVITARLDATETAAVEVAARQAGIDAVLLTALGSALAPVLGTPGATLVDLEGHGRGDAGAHATAVGWFTTLTPVRLTLGEPDAAALEQVRSSLADLPGDPTGLRTELFGAGAPGAASVNAPGAASMNAPGVVLNHLGRFDGLGGGLLHPAPGWLGRSRDPRNRRPWAVEVDSRIVEGQFEVAWTYNGAAHQAARVHRVVDDFLDALRVLAGVGPAAAEPAVRPVSAPVAADFPLAGLDDQQLAAVLAGFAAANTDAPQENR